MGTLKTKFGFVAALVAIAFTLPSFAALPDGYQQLEYIQASGQCRIKTGLTPAWDDKVEMTWQPTTVSGNQNLWCSRADGKQQFTAFMIGNTLRYDRNGKQTASAAIFAVGTRYSLGDLRLSRQEHQRQRHKLGLLPPLYVPAAQFQRHAPPRPCARQAPFRRCARRL